MPGKEEDLYLGIDFGTSACRALAITADGVIAAQAASPLAEPDQPGHWWRALTEALERLGRDCDLARVRRLAVDGTSGSLMLCSPTGEPVSSVLMYDDARAVAQAARVEAVAPANSAAHGATSAAAKLLWLLAHYRGPDPVLAVHQADWINGRLTGSWGVSDRNNVLKLGHDPLANRWPDWLDQLDIPRAALPRVLEPGTSLGTVTTEAAATTGLPAGIEVAAGTTDSVAAFLATGAAGPGDGVTSLGTTLVLKLVSEQPVFSPSHGVYSHPLGGRWLVGGASNSGGAVLLQHFTRGELERLSAKLDPATPTGLDWYPLPGTGERFPVNDPTLTARMDPPAPDRVTMLQGLFEGIAEIERSGYELLQGLGAPKVQRVYTTGGGSRNPVWKRIRERVLKMTLADADSEEAALGAARLAAGMVR